MRAPEGAQVELLLRKIGRKQTAAADNDQNNPSSVHHFLSSFFFLAVMFFTHSIDTPSAHNCAKNKFSKIYLDIHHSLPMINFVLPQDA